MDKIKSGITEGLVSIIINAALFCVKIWAGMITGSIALIADAWHTLSDSISSVFVVITVKLSSKEADEEHPFGHGRWEQIGSLSIAVVLGIIAYDFGKQSVEQFMKREKVEYGIIAIAVTIVSIVIKEAMAQYAFYVARKTGNDAIKADGWHHRTDSFSSVIVLIGILFAGQFWWIDSVLGMIIALTIAYATFDILKSSINKILGETPGAEFVDAVTKEIIGYYDEDLQLHHLHIHNYVSHKELTMHIRINKDITIEHGHEIASSIEKLIGEKFGMVTTIHVEPILYSYRRLSSGPY